MADPVENNKQEYKGYTWKKFYEEWGEPAVVAFLIVFFIIRPFFLQALG